MKRLIGAIATLALLVGVSAVAVHRFDDRELFVSPPDAIAEGYFRAVVSHRPAQALPYLLQPVGVDQIVALQQSIESRLGRVHDVKAELLSRTDEQAIVNVRLKADQAGEAIDVSLAWNGEEWKVVQSASP